MLTLDNVSMARWMGTALKPGFFHAEDHTFNGHPWFEICTAAFKGVRLLYVQNYKGNTQGICANMKALDDGHPTTRTFTFTFAREPLARFISGYSEAAWRYKDRFSNLCHCYEFVKQLHKQNWAAAATAFVHDVVDGRVGMCCGEQDTDLHFKPQSALVLAAMAKAQVPWSGLDFTGRLEALDDEWRRIGSLVYPDTPSLAARWPPFDDKMWDTPWHRAHPGDPHPETHTNAARTAMSELIASSLSGAQNVYRRTLCRILLPDYLCFGSLYPLPADCAAELGEHGVECIWGHSLAPWLPASSSSEAPSISEAPAATEEYASLCEDAGVVADGVFERPRLPYGNGAIVGVFLDGAEEDLGARALLLAPSSAAAVWYDLGRTLSVNLRGEVNLLFGVPCTTASGSTDGGDGASCPHINPRALNSARQQGFHSIQIIRHPRATTRTTRFEIIDLSVRSKAVPADGHVLPRYYADADGATPCVARTSHTVACTVEVLRCEQPPSAPPPPSLAASPFVPPDALPPSPLPLLPTALPPPPLPTLLPACSLPLSPRAPPMESALQLAGRSVKTIGGGGLVGLVLRLVGLVLLVGCLATCLLWYLVSACHRRPTSTERFPREATTTRRRDRRLKRRMKFPRETRVPRRHASRLSSAEPGEDCDDRAPSPAPRCTSMELDVESAGCAVSSDKNARAFPRAVLSRARPLRPLWRRPFARFEDAGDAEQPHKNDDGALELKGGCSGARVATSMCAVGVLTVVGVFSVGQAFTVSPISPPPVSLPSPSAPSSRSGPGRSSALQAKPPPFLLPSPSQLLPLQRHPLELLSSALPPILPTKPPPSPPADSPPPPPEEPEGLKWEWTIHPNLNCFNRHGALDLDTDATVESIDGCQERCHASPGCAGIVVHRTTADSLGRAACWRRSNVVVDECAVNTAYDVYTPSALAPELVAALEDYSVALYGAPGALATDHFRVLWPALLRDSVVDKLVVRCQDVPPWQYDAEAFLWIGGLAYRDLYQQAAIWVHRPKRLWPAPIVHAHSWVEVTHCGYQREDVTVRTPMWFLVVPGGGVHINVGRTRHFGYAPTDQRLDGEHWVPHAGYYWRTQTDVAVHIALMEGNVAEASRKAGENLRAKYDSVQFPLFAPKKGNWMGEAFTEVVMLNMLAEPDFLPEYIASHDDVASYLQCGPPDALRPCRVDEPAMAQVARGVCNQATNADVLRVAQNAGCDVPKPNGNYPKPGRPGGGG